MLIFYSNISGLSSSVKKNSLGIFPDRESFCFIMPKKEIVPLRKAERCVLPEKFKTTLQSPSICGILISEEIAGSTVPAGRQAVIIQEVTK